MILRHTLKKTRSRPTSSTSRPISHPPHLRIHKLHTSTTRSSPSSRTRPISSLLSPKTRTRLTNLSFLSAFVFSIAATVISAGSILPCPARGTGGNGIGFEGREGEREGAAGEKKKARRWLEDVAGNVRPVGVPCPPRRSEDRDSDKRDGVGD